MSRAHNSDPAPRVGWLLHIGPPVVYAAAIFYGGLSRLGALPEVGPVPTDKLLHALTFGGLALLVDRAIGYAWSLAGLRARLGSALFIASALGALLEVLQAFTSYRSADFFDWVADTLGAGFACALLLVARQVRAARSHA